MGGALQAARGIAAVSAVVAGCSGADPREPTGAAMTLDIEIGECEGGSSSYRAVGGSGTTGGYEVSAEVDAEKRIVVHLDNEWANCCPMPHASLAGNGNELTLAFHDVTGSSGCDCSCRTDFTVTTDPYLSGDWFLDVEYNDEPQGELLVTVP